MKPAFPNSALAAGAPSSGGYSVSFFSGYPVTYQKVVCRDSYVTILPSSRLGGAKGMVVLTSSFCRPPFILPGKYIQARSHEADEVVSRMQPGVPLLVRSVDFMGKSTFSRMVAGELARPSEVVTREVGCGGFRGDVERFRSHLSLVAARIISEKESVRHWDIYDAMKSNEKPPLKQLDDWLKSKGLFAVLMFKEAIDAVINLELAENIRGVSRIYPIVELHYHHKYEGLFRSRFDPKTTISHYLGMLTMDEMKEFIAEFQRRNSYYLKPMSTAALAYLYEITGGHPLLIHDLLVAFTNKPDLPVAVEQWMIKAKLGRNHPKLFKYEINKRMSPEQISLLRRVAKGDEVKVSEVDDEIRAPLVAMGFLRIGKEGFFEVHGKRLIHFLQTQRTSCLWL